MSINSILNKYESKQLITRFAPSPTAFCTLGHVKGLCLLDHVVKNLKNATLKLRYDDTNPLENYKPEYYEHILEVSKKLDVNFSTIEKCSDHLNRYVAYAKILIDKNKAFFCFCQPKKTFFESKECSCENLAIKDLLKTPSSAYSLKFKENSKSNFVILRCINSKWYPTIALQGPIDDYESGVNIIFHGRDLQPLAKRQNLIHEELFATPKPERVYWGRISLWNSLTNKKWQISKSILKESTKFPSLKYFENWGFSYKVLKEFFLSFGFTKNDIKMDLRNLFFFQIKFIKQRGICPTKGLKYVFWRNKKEPLKKNYGILRLKDQILLDLQRLKYYKIKSFK